jgi:hypothetical protein
MPRPSLRRFAFAATVAASIGFVPAGSPPSLAATGSGARVASDEVALRALHAKVIQAHRESNPGLLFEDVSEDFVQANRGAITRPTIDERRARFASYLGSTTFAEYRDLVEPIVKVSKDGTLGWVIAQVHARGVHTTEAGKKEPLEFVSAWIELYEKRDGRWISVGNVSNFK